MKTRCVGRYLKLLYIFVPLLLMSASGMAQDVFFNCGTEFDPKTNGAYASINLSQFGGIYLPSTDTVKILLVFVTYPDNNTPHPYWPAHQPPSNMNQYIDSNLTENSTNFSNLTNYFRQMSLGIYKVIGKSIFVQAPHDSIWYIEIVPVSVGNLRAMPLRGM